MRQKNQFVLIAIFLALNPLAALAQTTFFADTFGGGSTLNNPTPTSPTANSADYQLISSKTWTPDPSLTPGDLLFGIPATTSGDMEIQALFTTNAVALSQVGDYIQMTVTFTNTSGLLTEAGQLGFGLYNGSQVQPVPGGLNGTATSGSSTAATGGVKEWKGYVAQINYSGANSRIMTRPVQTGTGNNVQDLITSGSGSTSYTGQTTVGSTSPSTVILTKGNAYTEVLTIKLTDLNTLSITNMLYDGPGTSGTVLANFGGVASGSTYIASAFDGLAIGYFGRANATTNVMEISSINIQGHSTVITGPPLITTQPVPITVAAGGSGAFSVGATGFGVTYQWNRNGTNLVDDGYNISGATSSQLIVSHVGPGDALSGANGYYVTVSGTGGFSTNSVTNSLTLTSPKNLVWSGGSGTWDLATSANWLNGATPSVFNYGDNVTFDDTASLKVVNLSGSYLSAASVTVNSSGATYTFQGSGSFAGPGNLNYIGAGQLTLNNVNTYSGGTLISNELAYVYLLNYNGLGTGPITLAKAGGTIEATTVGGATLGFNGDVNVLDDFTIQFDGTGAYAGVFLGNLSGSTGKTLTLTQPDSSTTNRYRVYGANTVYDGNLVLNGASTSQAVYYGTVLAPYGSGTQIYNGVISGNGGLVQRGGTTILAGANTYSGGTVPTTASIGFGRDTVGNVTSGPIGTGALLIAPEAPSTSGSGTVFAYGGARTIANPLQYPSATNNQTLIIGGTNQLTFSGSIALQGQDGLGTQSNRIFQVANTAPTIFSGVVSDGGSGFGFTKTGAGALYLNNANTYTGPTTNSAGLLAGSGSLAGSVVVTSTNASIGGGSAASIGTLTIGGNLTLAQGGGFFRLNKGNAQTADKVSVTGTLSSSGTGSITVTNLGAALQVGDTFQLFNKPVTGAASLAVIGGGVTWSNALALNGTIQVVPGVDTTPTNITIVVNNGNIELSWPANHTGWYLEVQTNTVANGLGTNWVVIPNTQLNNSYTNPINPANGSVFYRMVYQ